MFNKILLLKYLDCMDIKIGFDYIRQKAYKCNAKLQIIPNTKKQFKTVY